MKREELIWWLNNHVKSFVEKEYKDRQSKENGYNLSLRSSRFWKISHSTFCNTCGMGARLERINIRQADTFFMTE